MIKGLLVIACHIVMVESAMYSTPGEKCGNIFKNKYDVASPWLEDCKVYKTSNACNRYELSREKDADTGFPQVLSCDIAEMCIAVVETPRCEEFYNVKSSNASRLGMLSSLFIYALYLVQ